RSSNSATCEVGVAKRVPPALSGRSRMARNCSGIPSPDRVQIGRWHGANRRRLPGKEAPMTGSSARIHRTALVHPTAQLADDVTVGPYVVIDGSVTLGPGCVVQAHAHLIGPLTLGRNNVIHTGAV